MCSYGYYLVDDPGDLCQSRFTFDFNLHGGTTCPVDYTCHSAACPMYHFKI